METILIAGGAGFLGTNLTRCLLNAGHRVVSLDNYLTSSNSNINPFISHPNFTFILHDITLSFPELDKIDKIYNLACPASPTKYQGQAAIFTLRTCFEGSLNLLKLAHTHNASVIQASTSEIYGEPLEHPQREEYRGNVNPIGIRACYDEGKRVAETLFFEYRRQYGVDTKVVRIFNTYGPWMDPNDGRVVSNLICQALRGEPLTLYGDGMQTRSFCYVDDLLEAMIRVMHTSSDFSGPVNIGNPDEFTVRQLAELIIVLTGSDSNIVYRTLPHDDPIKRQPNIELARKVLHWQPYVTLESGLERTIAYFRKLIDNKCS